MSPCEENGGSLNMKQPLTIDTFNVVLLKEEIIRKVCQSRREDERPVSNNTN
jgi:hypothetical protein